MVVGMILAACVGAAPVSADLAQGEAVPSAEARAAAVPAGYGESEVAARTARLTDEERAYFEARPVRVQCVAGLSVAEYVGGVILIGGAAAAIIALINK